MATADLTTHDLQRAFGVTAMTVHNWRKGSPQRPQLEATSDGRSVRFKPAKVRAWAKKTGINIVDETALTAATSTAKPGPKPVPK